MTPKFRRPEASGKSSSYPPPSGRSISNPPLPKYNKTVDLTKYRFPVFWLVWNPATGLAKKKHQTEAVAQGEAARLADKYPGHRFVVLKARTRVQRLARGLRLLKYNYTDEVSYSNMDKING